MRGGRDGETRGWEMGGWGDRGKRSRFMTASPLLRISPSPAPPFVALDSSIRSDAARLYRAGCATVVPAPETQH